ncbi:MAG: cupin [Acidobacteriota bacterium]
MKRRIVTNTLAALGLGSLSFAAEPEAHLLGANGWVPNHERLPLLLFRQAFRGGVDACERFIRSSGWQPEWRNGVYPFHHYHSTAHELLGVAGGEARLLLGGEAPRGLDVTVRAGDLIILPCGTGHCRVSASGDFLVVGAYALEQRWDLMREAPTAAQRQAMRALPYPKGGLTSLWR